MILGQGHSPGTSADAASEPRLPLTQPARAPQPVRGSGQHRQRGLESPLGSPSWLTLTLPSPTSFLLASENLEMSATLPCLPPTFSSMPDPCVPGLSRHSPGPSPRRCTLKVSEPKCRIFPQESPQLRNCHPRVPSRATVNLSISLRIQALSVLNLVTTCQSLCFSHSHLTQIYPPEHQKDPRKTKV